jgi:hypothetical protein
MMLSCKKGTKEGHLETTVYHQYESKVKIEIQDTDDCITPASSFVGVKG